MRIGLVTPGFCATEDDWCIPALTHLTRGLAERDEVVVFSTRYPHRRDTYQVHGVTVHPTGGAQRHGLARLPILLRTAQRIRQQARHRPFDVLCAHWAHEPGFVATLAGRWTATPVMVSVLGGELVDLPAIDYGGQRSRANRWLSSRALAAADAVTVGSQTLMQLAEHHVPRHKLFQHPLGIDLDHFNPGPVSSDAPRLSGSPCILSVASLVPVKDHHLLLAAFANLAAGYPDARLHLAGSGPLRPNLEDEARRLGIDSHVTLHGDVEHDALPNFYRQADLLVLSSHYEAQGMVALEAAACGCPVVGTAVGILPEICPPETLASPGDAAALAAVLAAAVENPRQPSWIDAQMAAVQRFDRDRTRDSWRQRLARLVDARQAGEGERASDATG